MKKLLPLIFITISCLSYAQTAQELYHLSLTELRNGNYKKGIELIDEFINKYPDFESIHMIYLNRASAKSLINNYQGAIDDYSLAYEKNPKYAEAIRQRGYVPS